MDPELIKFVAFLDRNRIRATYAAVGDAANIPQRSVGSRLRDRCPLASWVVSDKTGEPAGYDETDKHGYPPDLSEDATLLVLKQAELSTEYAL